MTIANSIRKAGPFVGNDITATFPFEFKIFEAGDLYAVKLNTATGVEAELVLDSDYTVSINPDQNADPGGNLVTSSPLPTGYSLTITSVLDYTQPLDLTNAGGFYPATINTAFDRCVMQIQQLVEKVGRTLGFSSADTATTGNLPTLAQRKSMLLGFDSSGNPTVYPYSLTTSAGTLANPWVDARAYGSLLEAVLAIGTEANITLMVSSDMVVSDSFEIPSNIALAMVKGGLVTISSGKTLTINGPFSAGLYQVFAGSGSVVFAAQSIKEVPYQWFNNLQKAVTAAAQVKKVTLNGAAISTTATVTDISGVSIYGPGSITINTNGSVSLIHILSYSGASDFEVKDVTFNRLLNGATPGNTLGTKLTGDGNGLGSAIAISNSHNFNLERNTISYQTNGIEVTQGYDFKVSGNKITAIGQQPLVFRDCSDYTVDSNDLSQHVADGILIKNQGSTITTGAVRVRGNHIYNPANGGQYNVVLGAGYVGGGVTGNLEDTGPQIDDVEISGNSFNALKYGVYFVASGGIRVIGNKLKNITEYPIAFINNFGGGTNPDSIHSTESVIADNTIDGGVGKSVTRAAILSVGYESGSANSNFGTTITGNTIINTIGNYAIYGRSSAITGNIIKAFSTSDTIATACVYADGGTVNGNIIEDAYSNHIIEAVGATVNGNEITRRLMTKGHAATTIPLYLNDCTATGNRINAGSLYSVFINSVVNDNKFDNTNANNAMVQLFGKTIFAGNILDQSDTATYTTKPSLGIYARYSSDYGPSVVLMYGNHIAVPSYQSSGGPIYVTPSVSGKSFGNIYATGTESNDGTVVFSAP